MVASNRFRRARRRKPLRSSRKSGHAGRSDPPAGSVDAEPARWVGVGLQSLGTRTYAEVRYSDWEREHFLRSVDRSSRLLGEDFKGDGYQRELQTFRRWAQRWQLSDAEAASLLKVSESTWRSGRLSVQFNSERLCRIQLVPFVLDLVEQRLGHAGALRWLREPGQEPMLAGAVPIEELTQADSVRLSFYLRFVERQFSPAP